MVNLTKKSGESYEALKKLHELTGKDVFAFDKNGNYKGLENHLKTLKSALDSLTSEEDRNTIIQSIAGKTQMKTFTKLLAQINGEYDTLKSKVRNSNGELDRMHETVSQSNWAKFKEMLSAIQEALLQIWEVIQPFVMFLVQKVTDLANKFSSLSDEQQLSIVKFLAMVTVVPMLIKSLGYFLLMVGSIVKAIGFLIIGVGKMGSAFFGVISFVLTFIHNLQKADTIAKGLALTFPKVAEFITSLKISFMYLAEYITGTVVPALATLAGVLGLPLWATIAVIGAIVGAIGWMVSAWKRGFDEMADPITNLGNMLDTMLEDIGHFFISIWNGVCELIGKLTGKSKEKIEEMKKLSKKDKDAIAEGYKDHKDKKKQEKKAKKEAKKAEKAENGTNLISKTGNFVKDSVGKLGEKITMNVDDGGFFGEFAGFMDGYEEFAQDFTKNKKTANFETKMETDVLELIEAEDKLKTLKNEYSDMEVNVELAKDDINYCNDRIQELINERRQLEIEPEANKKRLKEIEKEIKQLTERREANIEVVSKGDEKLAEIKAMEDELKDKNITITTEYKELGKDEELQKVLNQEKFYREFGFELLHEDFIKDTEFVKERIKAIPNEIGELEKQLELDLDPETKNNVINQLTALQEEQIMLDLKVQYINEAEILQRCSNIKEELEAEMQSLNVEASKIEWVSKQGIQLTEDQKTRLEEIKDRQKRITDEIKEQTEIQETANSTLKALGEDNIAKLLEYFTKTTEENQKLAEEMGIVSEKTGEVAQKVDDIDMSSAKEETDNFKDSLDGATESANGLSEVLDFEYDLDVETETARDGLDKAKTSADNTKASLEGLSNTSSNVNVDGLSSGLEKSKSLIETIREKLISINNIANSTSLQAFSNMGQILVEKLTEARTATLNIAGVARNSGVNAMKTMGQALTNALSGARQRVIDVANVAKNYGASAMRAMGQALISQLNQAKRIVSSIASSANSIRISVPTPSSGGNTGGKSRALLTAQYDDFVMPTSGIRALSNISNTTNNSSNSNSFSFNIDKVVMDSKSDIKKTAKQFTIMCQREGILK